MDDHRNFAVSAVATAPSPADTGTSLVVTAGHGTRFPTAPFNAVVHATGADPTPDNAEVIRVTARVTDTLTITRGQEGSTARSIVVGDRIYAAITDKVLTDIEDATVADLDNPETGALTVATAKYHLTGPRHSATAAQRIAVAGTGRWRLQN